MKVYGTAALMALAACQTAAPYDGTQAAAAPRVGVEAWLTTGDQRVLLARQPDVAFGSTSSGTAWTITIDPAQAFQEMIGFGAAMTDASAWLIQNKMSAADREKLLQDLFGRDSGVGFSFVRTPMGASDFSMTHYTYDDVPAPQTDSALDHFSIEPDRAAKLPLLRRALAINPQLKVMAS